MTPIKKIIFLITFLFVPSFLVGCGGKKEDEKEQLVLEENELMNKLQQQTEPAKWAESQTAIQEKKTDRKKREEAIAELTDMPQAIDDMRTGKMISVSQLNYLNILAGILSGLTRKNIHQDAPLLKSYIANLLALYENFNKQQLSEVRGSY